MKSRRRGLLLRIARRLACVTPLERNARKNTEERVRGNLREWGIIGTGVPSLVLARFRRLQDLRDLTARWADSRKNLHPASNRPACIVERLNPRLDYIVKL